MELKGYASSHSYLHGRERVRLAAGELCCSSASDRKHCVCGQLFCSEGELCARREFLRVRRSQRAATSCLIEGTSSVKCTARQRHICVQQHQQLSHLRR